MFKRGFVGRNTRREAIYEVYSCFKGKVPEALRETGLSQEGESSFHNVTMTAFNKAILLAGVRTRPSMNDAKVATKSGEGSKFSPPVRLNTF